MLKLGGTNFNNNGIKGLYFLLGGLQRTDLPIFWYSTSSSTSLSEEGNPCSSLSNYLVHSLGFSIKQSVSTSVKLTKQRRLERSQNVRDTTLVDNSVTVVNFLKQHGFQDSHIRKVVFSVPKILVSKVDTTLKPKIKVLLDLGFSGSELVFAAVRNPSILTVKLDRVIAAFRTVLGSDENVISVLKCYMGTYLTSAVYYLIPNVEMLQNYYGIPSVKIRKHIIRQPNPFLLRTDLFRDKLIRIEEKFGIPRDSVGFLYGLPLACYTDKSIEDKFLIYKSFGWTQSDVIALVRRNPMWLTYSEARIREHLDFLMNKLDYQPDYLAGHIGLLVCSFKKRLLPRHSVLLVLKEKGLTTRSCSLASAVNLTENLFLKGLFCHLRKFIKLMRCRWVLKLSYSPKQKQMAIPKVGIGCC